MEPSPFVGITSFEFRIATARGSNRSASRSRFSVNSVGERGVGFMSDKIRQSYRRSIDRFPEKISEFNTTAGSVYNSRIWISAHQRRSAVFPTSPGSLLITISAPLCVLSVSAFLRCFPLSAFRFCPIFSTILFEQRKNHMRHLISPLIFAALLAAAVTCASIPAFAAEEVCGACDKKVLITGQYEHGTSDTFAIANAPGNEAAFRDEIRGPRFTLTVPDLMPGKYTVDIGLVELKFDHPGQRVFDITC